MTHRQGARQLRVITCVRSCVRTVCSIVCYVLLWCVTRSSGGGQNCLRKVESTNSSGAKVRCNCVEPTSPHLHPLTLALCQIVDWVEVQRQFEVSGAQHSSIRGGSTLQPTQPHLCCQCLTVACSTQVDLLCDPAFPPLIPLSLAASAISHGLVSTCDARACSNAPLTPLRWWPWKCASVNTVPLFRRHWHAAALLVWVPLSDLFLMLSCGL